MSPKKRLGNVIRRRRLELGLTQQQLAERYGHDRRAIGRYEAGRGRPTIAHVDQLARALGLDINEFREIAGYPPLDRRDAVDLRMRLMEVETTLLQVRAMVDAALERLRDGQAALTGK